MTNSRQPRPRIAEPVCVRYPAKDLELVEVAMSIMGDATISVFTRSASVALAKAIIAAAADAGIRAGETGWDRSWIEGSLERKP